MLLLMIGKKRRTPDAEPPTPNLDGKRRRHSIVAFEMVRLDRAAAEPLHQQLYRQIRDELVSGTFSNGASRLPSSRELAADLGRRFRRVSLHREPRALETSCRRISPI